MSDAVAHAEEVRSKMDYAIRSILHRGLKRGWLAWQEQHPGVWWGNDGDKAENILGRMEWEGVSMYVFTSAGFRIFGDPGRNPSTEIIVRQRQPPPPSDWFGGYQEGGLPHRSCLSDEQIGLRFHTGFGGGLPCQCDTTLDYLNCDLSG